MVLVGCLFVSVVWLNYFSEDKSSNIEKKNTKYAITGKRLRIGHGSIGRRTHYDGVNESSRHSPKIFMSLDQIFLDVPTTAIQTKGIIIAGLPDRTDNTLT